MACTDWGGHDNGHGDDCGDDGGDDGDGEGNGDGDLDDDDGDDAARRAQTLKGLGLTPGCGTMGKKAAVALPRKLATWRAREELL